jgi:hypothetical protein
LASRVSTRCARSRAGTVTAACLTAFRSRARRAGDGRA